MAKGLLSLFAHGTLWKGGEYELSTPTDTADAIYFGLPEVGLPKGFIHEFTLVNSLTSQSHRRWQAPLFLTANLLRNLFGNLFGDIENCNSIKSVIWIGRQCWPTPIVLEASVSTSHSHLKQLIKDSQIFLDPQSTRDRLWSITEALRSPGVAAVIADGSKLNLLASRRIQLAAQKNGTICFLMRPPWEISQPSSAYSRWQLCSIPTALRYPAWELTLLRCRGIHTPRSWSIELYEENTIRILSPTSDRTNQKEAKILSQSETEFRSITAHQRTA